MKDDSEGSERISAELLCQQLARFQNEERITISELYAQVKELREAFAKTPHECRSRMVLGEERCALCNKYMGPTYPCPQCGPSGTHPESRYSFGNSCGFCHRGQITENQKVMWEYMNTSNKRG